MPNPFQQNSLKGLLVCFLLLVGGCATSGQATKPESAGAPSAPAAPSPAANQDANDSSRPDAKTAGRLVSHTSDGSRRQPARGEVFVERGIEYGTWEGRPLTLDRLQGERLSKPPVPVIVFLDAATNRRGPPPKMLEQLAAKGKYICLRVPCVTNVDPANPARAPECVAAIQWIATRAHTCDMNPDRIGIWLSWGGGELVGTLQRGSTNLLTQSALGRGEDGGRAESGSLVYEAETFFDQHLRGEAPQSSPAPKRMPRRGAGRWGPDGV